ncbi:reverse transcriptase/ribonuclease h/methyltransferase [Elysia marginata]|uniref:Reverse transcriptase/ribonuclease h/methyltransferase n=1 Tax=Elysia marginata TaxID=1093978 RepID=A0AAV4HR29_9GAST|nr:reverse transcriptase/ribonuclease h/methyltransferase [Elysia marginata]
MRQWCIENDNRVTAIHIPGKDNLVADRESRLDKREIEWQLNKDVFRKLDAMFGPFEIDLFASRLNVQVPKYISWKCDQGAWAVDAMLAAWTSLDRMYAFPLFSLLPAVFQKMHREKVDILVVLPLWRTQSWWSHMLSDLVDTPVVLDHHKQILRHPQYPAVQHPLFPKNKFVGLSLIRRRLEIKGKSEKVILSA